MKKSFIYITAVCSILLLNIGTIASAASTYTAYTVTLPANQGVAYKQAPNNKYSSTETGSMYCQSMSDQNAGSYAMDYQMTNSNNDVRGVYSVAQRGYYQNFSNMGSVNYTYYIKCMNHNSISVDNVVNGSWSSDPMTNIWGAPNNTP